MHFTTKLYTLALMLIFSSLSFAQVYEFQTRIKENGDPIEEELDDGTVLILNTSTDDAEQEQNFNEGYNQIDALYDDDLDAGYEGQEGDDNIVTTGLRFVDINIPKGATITEAFLTVWSHEQKTNADVAPIVIYGEASDFAETYNENDLITDRPYTNASVNWDVTDPWGIWTAQQSIDFSPIVQEIIDRPGWATGNPINLILTAERGEPSLVENAREFSSFENIADPEDTDEFGNNGDGKNHPERVPQLTIRYTMEGEMPTTARLAIPIIENGDPIEEELDDGTIITLKTSTDDAEQEQNFNEGYNQIDALYDDDLDAGYEGQDGDDNIVTTGLRFQNVMVPKGAQIDNAYLRLSSHEAKSQEDAAQLLIYGEASDFAETYNETDLITDRPSTNAQITWTVDEVWGLWSIQNSTDLSPIVQEIIDRDGWQTGNPVNIIMTSTNLGPQLVETAREFQSFENIFDPEDGGDGKHHPERVPHLIIDYTSTNSVFDLFQYTEELNVFPNPISNGNLTFDLDSFQDAKLYIYNASGNTVFAGEYFGTQQISVNIDNLNLVDGAYYVLLNQNGKLYSSEFIKN